MRADGNTNDTFAPVQIFLYFFFASVSTVTDLVLTLILLPLFQR